MFLKRNIVIISVFISLLGLNIYSKKVEEIKVNNFISSDSNKNSYNKDMVGVLEIPKIKLKKSLYGKDSIYNNVDKNLEILPSSDMPDKERGNVIIAGHSGVGSKAYFNELVKLNINDEAYIYYNNSKYIYKLNNVYEIDKTGNANIIRNKNISTLTLITCKINSNKQLIYIFNLEKV